MPHVIESSKLTRIESRRFLWETICNSEGQRIKKHLMGNPNAQAATQTGCLVHRIIMRVHTNDFGTYRQWRTFNAAVFPYLARALI